MRNGWVLNHRRPVAVIGTGKAVEGEAPYDTAREVGRELATRGIAVVCGGRHGVMEAVCRGVDEAGGLAIGVLPYLNDPNANTYAGNTPLYRGH